MNRKVKSRYKKLVNHKVNPVYRNQIVLYEIEPNEGLTYIENSDLLSKLFTVNLEMDKILRMEEKLTIDSPVYSKKREEILLIVSEIKNKSGNMLKKSNYMQDWVV